jgi:hypothetical protein
VKSRILDTAGINTVHIGLKIKDDYIFMGSPFLAEIKVTAGKKGAVVKRINSTVYMQTMVPDDRTAIQVLDIILNLTGLVGSMIAEGGTSGTSIAQKVIRVPLHEAAFRRATKLGPEKSKTLKVIPSIPGDYPMEYPSQVILKVEVKVRDAPDVEKEKRLRPLPNIFICAPYVVLIEKFGFKNKELWKPMDPRVSSKRFVLVPAGRSNQRVKEIHLTSTDLKDGRMEYVLAFEMYERSNGPFRGKHETVMVLFELYKELLLKKDGSFNMEPIEEKVREAFDEAESKFGKVQSFRM